MTENVNGIQVDVSKYVGEEIARLAVASIDEDRLNRLAEKAIRDLYETQWFEGQRTTTIHRMAAQLLGEKIQQHITDILERDGDALMKVTQEGKSFHIFEEDMSSENCSDGACDIKW